MWNWDKRWGAVPPRCLLWQNVLEDKGLLSSERGCCTNSKQTKCFLQLRCTSDCRGERCQVWKSRPWSWAIELLLETCKTLSEHLWKCFYYFCSSSFPLHLGFLFILLCVKQFQCALCWTRHKTKTVPGPRVLLIWNKVHNSNAWFWSQGTGSDMAHTFIPKYFTWDNSEGDHMFMRYL